MYHMGHIIQLNQSKLAKLKKKSDYNTWEKTADLMLSIENAILGHLSSIIIFNW